MLGETVTGNHEVVVWVNEEGSVTAFAGTALDAVKLARRMEREALEKGWKVTGIEIDCVEIVLRPLSQ